MQRKFLSIHVYLTDVVISHNISVQYVEASGFALTLRETVQIKN